MSRPARRTADLRVLLDRVAGSSPVEAVDVMADELATMLGADDVCFLIADLGGRAVARFGGSAANAAGVHEQGGRPATVPLAGTVYERVLRSQRAESVPAGAGVQLVVPVTDRGDAIGLIELCLPWHPDEQEIGEIAAAGRALAYVVMACRRHTDLFEWAQRSTPFSLAAEIQRRLLPEAFTCEAGQFAVSGWLEPANAVGGDTFDYALDRDALHLSITDAVGHDVNAALLATVLVGSLRNARRHDLGLLEQARFANDALCRHSPVGEFVTGQLARVDLGSGMLSIVNAGHPFPYQVRDGRAAEIELGIDLPFGIEPGREFGEHRLQLAAGDRIVLVSDGMLERNAERIDLGALLADTALRHPREVVYVVGEAVLRACGGNLRDDATVLCVDWHGGPGRVRDVAGVPRQPGAEPPAGVTSTSVVEAPTRSA